MKNKLLNPINTILTGGALVLAATAAVHAQSQAYMQAGTAQPPTLPALPATAVSVGTNTPAANPVQSFLNGKIPAALADGTLNVNVRLRYEQADEEGIKAITKDSYAPTIRTRIGYATAPLYGFQAMVEGVNVSDIGPEANYNAAGSNNQGARPIIPDPPMTRLDQAWAGYSHTNLISAKIGRQQINLDNQRFIGDSAWWQNMQTYDAATVKAAPFKDFDLYYGYIWDVHRIYGDVPGLASKNTDFNSYSHVINVSYSGWKYGRFVGYTYLLDLSNAAGAANSSATYGGYFAGNAPVSDTVAFDYRAEFAWQTDYADSALRYGTHYYNFEGGVTVKPFAFGAGYEDLGSGDNTGAGGGRIGFSTPLATLHPFNGWDNVFLTTPNDGLRDLYGYAQVTLPAHVPLRFVYHKFDADYGSGNYGQEFDLLAARQLGKYWNISVEYAYYQGQDTAAGSFLATAPNVDVQKVWAQVEFKF